MSDQPKAMLPSELVRIGSVRHKDGPFFDCFVEVWTGMQYERLCDVDSLDNDPLPLHGDGSKQIDILNRMIEQIRSET